MIFLPLFFGGGGDPGLHGALLLGVALAFSLACLVTPIPLARSAYRDEDGFVAAMIFALVFCLTPLAWAAGILYVLAIAGGWLLIPEFRQKRRSDKLAAKRKEAERVAKEIERLEAEILSGSRKTTTPMSSPVQRYTDEGPYRRGDTQWDWT